MTQVDLSSAFLAKFSVAVIRVDQLINDSQCPNVFCILVWRKSRY